MRIALTCFLLAAAIGITAQVDAARQARIDSLSIKLKADSMRLYRFHTIRPYANLDNRFSFIRREPVNVKGGQVGIIFKESHAFGFGYYMITNQSERSARTTDSASTLNINLTLNYTTLFYQYLLLDHRFLEIDLPFELGYGKYTLKLQDSRSEVPFRTLSQSIVPLGAGVQLVLKPVRWVGVSTMGGYRYVSGWRPAPNFNGLYYSFGLWVDIRQVYRDVRYYGFIKRRYREQVKEVLRS